MLYKCSKCNNEWTNENGDNKFCQKCGNKGNPANRNVNVKDSDLEPIFSLTGMVNSKDFSTREEYDKTSVVYTTDGHATYNSYETELQTSMEVL